MIRQTKTMLWRTLATEEDLLSLIESGYIHQFPSDTIVIMDWLKMNYITGVKYKKTENEDEYALLDTLPSKRYILRDAARDAQYRAAQGSVAQDSITQDSVAWKDSMIYNSRN